MLRQAQRTLATLFLPSQMACERSSSSSKLRLADLATKLSQRKKKAKKEGVFETLLHFNTQSGEERRGDQPWPIVSCCPRICPPPSNSKERNKKEAACLLAEKTEV